jgi:hypothetical protein
VAVAFVTLAAFLGVLSLGLAADGHGLHSDDHYTWFRTTEEITFHTLATGGAVMWVFAVFGGRRGGTVQGALLRAAVGLVIAALVWPILPSEHVDAVTVAGATLCIAGSIAACIFAGRHSWRVVALACAPYLFVFLAVAFFFMFAPPNLGPEL